MSSKLLRKALSLLCALVLSIQIVSPGVFAAENPAPADQPTEAVLWARLTAGEANGNDHFGGAHPEAFVLTPKDYQNEGFSFVMKFNSEINDSRFRFVTRYIDDQNWCYIAYDGYQGQNHWFCEYKVNGAGGWPDLGGLPVLNKGDEVKLSGTYTEAGLTLTVENLTTAAKGTAEIANPGVQELKAGKVGFGAAKWGDAVTDVQIRDFVMGEDVFDEAAYKAMAAYQDKIGSWVVGDPEPPEPTDPEPTDPEPTDPEPTDPEPTDPEPTDPEPTDPVDPEAPELITWARLVSGEGNGNGHFGSGNPEAFVLTAEDYTNEAFDFVVKFNSEINDTRFRFVNKYVDDSNWCYVAFDGYQGKNHWFSEYKVNGQGGWPDLGGLPVLNKGDEIRFTGAYEGAKLMLTVENLTTLEKGSAVIEHAGVQADKAGKVGFGAAKWGAVNTDVSIRDLVIGEKTFDKAAYEAMTPYKNMVGSWTVEQVKPADPNEGKLWYRITTGPKNTNSHNYGDPNKNAPALVLDQSRTVTVGEKVTMTIKPSENFGLFYTYLNDSAWLYVGYDTTSKWYYQYRANGAEEYPKLSDLPAPVAGQNMTVSVALDRETLMVTVDGQEVKIPNSKLLAFSDNQDLKTKGRFGVKTMGTLEFTDPMLGKHDCMADTWDFAAQREGQNLTQIRSTVRPLTGFVRNGAGEPLADAAVIVGSKQAKTDETGAYTVNGLDLGRHTVAVTCAGYAPYKGEVTITDKQDNTLDVVLQPKGELDLAAFDQITDGKMTVYIGKTFPVIARYVMADGTFFRGNEEAAYVDSLKLNGVPVTPTVEVLETKADSRDYKLTVQDAASHLDLTMEVRISTKDATASWRVTKLTKADGCAPIATIEFPQLNLLSVSAADAAARFDGALASSDTTVSGDRTATFTKGFKPSTSGAYLYAFLSTDTLSAGLESNSEVEGDKRIVLNNGADTMSLTGNVWYHERGDKNGQKYGGTYPVSELPCMKVAIGGDMNADGAIDWNDGALAYRKIMHKAYRSEVIKDLVNYRIIMNFASMAPDPYLQTADNVKKVFLATDGLPQALLLKGYGSEGHDSANSEYAHIADREGGVEDFRKLLRIAHQYNTEVGVHINAQEAYPEAKSFCPELIGGPNGTGNGWGWLDQSHVIDKHWDLQSGARWKRLVQFYDRINGTHHLNRDWEKGEYVLNSLGKVDATMAQLKKEGEDKPDNMDFIYLDVWYQDSWESRQIAKQINSLGWRFSTEFSTSCEYDSTWQHWATEGSYGGAGAKGFNSDIIRFIRNDQRDSQVLNYPSYGGTADNPLLGGFQLKGFEGWGSQRDFGDYITGTFNDNLPTKFLQHYYVTDWENYAEGESPVGNHEKQITLRNDKGDTVVVTRNETQRKDNNIERTIVLNDRVVLNNVTYLLPWTDHQDRTEKLYHWNLDGGTTTWELTPSWNGKVTVYKLTDQGRVEPQTLTVSDGKLTLTADAATPYVVVRTAGVKTLRADFGEMDYVTDPGFNGYAGHGSKLDKADWTGDIADPSVTVELSETEDQRLQFASPEKDVAVSTTIRNLIPGKDYVAEIYVQNDTNLPATLEVDAGEKTVSVWAGHSYVKNYVRCDNKSAYSSMQRMQVSFVAESETAVLTLKRAAGAGCTYMDGIRIVQQKLDNYQPDGSFKQDFESVVQGLYPFVLGPAQGVDDPRTHLAELHAPYTQYGWNNRIVDDVIEGSWSLKHHNQSTGVIYQTLPQNFRFQPGVYYTVEFDYQTGSDKAYAMVIGDDESFYQPTDSQLLPITGGREVDGKTVGNTRHVRMIVQGAEDGNTWIGLYSPGGVAGGAFGQMDFILDNLVIREDTKSVVVSLSDNHMYVGETAAITVTTPDPKGGVTSWDNTDPAVAAVDGDKVNALTAGTTTLTAHLTDGTTQSFEITVVDEEDIGLHGVSVEANTEERGNEGPVNGYASAASDGDESTFWHSQWSGDGFKVSEKNPAVITVDLGAEQTVNGIQLLQRPSGGNGLVQKYRYRILNEAREPIRESKAVTVPKALQANAKWIETPFAEPLSGARYIEISVLQGNNGFAALSEIQAQKHVVIGTTGTVAPVTVRVDEEADAVLTPASPDEILAGVVWSAPEQNILTIDQKGHITPKMPGTATIYATNAAGLKAEATVTVIGLKTIAITKAPDKTVYEEGDPLDLTGMEVTLTYEDDTTKLLTGDMERYPLLTVRFHEPTGRLTVSMCGKTSDAIVLEIRRIEFEDTKGHWGERYIKFVVKEGLFTGLDETTFGPDMPMNRAMFVTVLGRMAEIPADGSGKTQFTDVAEDQYYAPYVAWAVEQGIVSGYTETTFAPDEAVTREEMAVLLSRFCASMQIKLEQTQEAELSDADAISDWAQSSVRELVGAGVIQGHADGRFAPRDSATRAEVAAMLTRFLETIRK